MKVNRLWVLMIVTLCASLFLSGCQSVRKKFVRQKKKNAEDKFIPILEPIDYGTSEVSQAERYGHHYQTYRIWERELMAGIERGEADKRLEYYMDQLVVNLESLIKWVPEERQGSLQEVLVDYQSASEYFKTPNAFRNRAGFVSRLKRYERNMRKEFKPNIVFAQNQE